MIRYCRHIGILLVASLFIVMGCKDGARNRHHKLSVVDSLLNKADSLYEMSNAAGAISMQLQAYMRAKTTDKKAQIQIDLAHSHYFIGDISITKNLLEQAIKHFDTIPFLNDTLLNHKLEALTLYADVFVNEGLYKEAVKQFTKAAKVAKQLGEKETYLNCSMAIMRHEELAGNYGSAIDGYRDLLNYCDQSDVASRFNICSRLHKIFLSLGNIDDAEMYLNTMKRLVAPDNKFNKYVVDVAEMHQARYVKDSMRILSCVSQLRKEVNDPTIAEQYDFNAMGLLGEYYMDANMYDSAKYYINRFLEVAKYDKRKSVTGYANLILVQSLIYENKLDSARRILFDKEMQSICNHSVEMREKMLRLMSTLHFKFNNFKESYKYIRKVSELSDSIQAEVISHNFAYKDMAYQRDTTILTNSIRISQKQSRLDNLAFWQSVWVFIIIFSIIGSIIVALRVALDLIKDREKAIYQQNLVLQHEVVRRTTILQSQKIELERTNERLNKEIEYASRIQNDSLPPESRMDSEMLKNHFVFYRPCAHISGDFYWFNRFGSKLIVCCADATGHGIPGAFVAMVCSTMLNDIYARPKQNSASLMTALDENMRNILLNNVNEHSNDSVDMSMLCIDEETGEMEMSLARHNAYIVRTDGTLEVVHGVKRSIGDLDEAFIARPFVSQKLNINSGDKILLTTDGLESQFGGEKGEKLKRQRMTSMFKELAKEPSGNEIAYLDEYFSKWKADYEQTDDVLVIGMTIK